MIEQYFNILSQLTPEQFEAVEFLMLLTLLIPPIINLIFKLIKWFIEYMYYLKKRFERMIKNETTNR